MEVNAEVVFKATKVDGVYDADPLTNPKAKRFARLDYLDLINKDLRVMDHTAVTLCRENNIPIIVFDRPNLPLIVLVGAFSVAHGIAVLAILWAPNVLAHAQKGEAAGLLTGFLHPISGLDHVLAMVAVGLWGAVLGMPAIWAPLNETLPRDGATVLSENTPVEPSTQGDDVR